MLLSSVERAEVAAERASPLLLELPYPTLQKIQTDLISLLSSSAVLVEPCFLLPLAAAEPSLLSMKKAVFPSSKVQAVPVHLSAFLMEAEEVAAAERIARRKQVFLKMFLFQFSGRKKRIFLHQETLFSQAPFVARKAYYRRINTRPAAGRISVAYEGSLDRDARAERFHKDSYMIIRSISKAIFTFVPDGVPASSYRSVTRI